MEIKVIASGSKGNCYLVGDGRSCLLLDAGVPLPRIQKGCGYGLHELAGCLVTHIHKDHSLSVGKLAKRGVQVFGTGEMAEAGLPVRNVRGYAQEKRPLSAGTFSVRPFLAVHDCECYGYFLRSQVTGERLVYLTDSARIPYRFENVDYWLIEANHGLKILDRNVAGGLDRNLADRIIETHLSIEKLQEYFSGYDYLPAKEIYLIHLSEGNSDKEEFAKIIESTTGTPCTVRW